jgi:anti-sigma factor RsiW
MTCREFADFMLEYTTGELPPEVLALFERHLHRCPNCREYLALYEVTVALGRRAFDDAAEAVEAGVPDDLVAAILSSRRASRIRD